MSFLPRYSWKNIGGRLYTALNQPSQDMPRFGTATLLGSNPICCTSPGERPAPVEQPILSDFHRMCHNAPDCLATHVCRPTIACAKGTPDPKRSHNPRRGPENVESGLRDPPSS